MKRTAIHIIDKNQIELREADVPDVGPNDLLVRTTRSVISTGTESIAYTRNYGPGTHWDQWLRYPMIPGYLNCGVVEAVGSAVTKFKCGDRVASGGAHASLVVVGETRAAGVPEGVPDEEAAWTHLGLITQVGARAGEQLLGESVAIVGAGLLGQLVIQYAFVQGAKDVIVIDTSAARLAHAARHGATLTLQMDAKTAKQRVYDATAGRGVDLVYDITGNAKVLGPALGLIRRYGRLVLLGDTGHTSEQNVAPELIVSGLRIIGAHASHIPEHATEFQWWSMVRCYELFLDYVARGRMRIGPLITHRVKPTDAPAIYDLLQKDRENTMGVVFDWS